MFRSTTWWRAPQAWAISFGLILMAGSAWAQDRVPGEVPAKASLEEGLWTEFAKVERNAATSAERITDPALEGYLKEVSCRVAPEFCNELRIYVMDRPIFNATAAANGYIEVWSGLMLAASNEAELAFVLGHEISHYTSTDSLDAFNRMKSTRMVATVAAFAVGAAGIAAAGNQTTMTDVQNTLDISRSIAELTYFGIVATYFRFSRDQEMAADIAGQQRLTRAGYDARSGVDIWKAVTEIHDSSDFKETRRRGAVSSVFNTHPINSERIAYLEGMAKATPEKGDQNQEAYRNRIRPFLKPWLNRTLEMKDFGYTLNLVDRLAKPGTDLGVLLFIRGEAYRKRNQDGDAKLAIQAFQEASKYPDAPVELYRELGGVAASAGEHDVAKAAFGKYLELAPQAEDAWLVKESMEAL